MRILYITRKFPPSIGGMQTQSAQFYKYIRARNEVILIAWGHSQIFLPFFAAFAFIKSALLKARGVEIDIIQLGDLVLAPLGVVFKLLFNRPVMTVSHGRDSAYRNIIYDFLVIGAANRLDKVICVSDNMKQRLFMRGIGRERLSVIPNGIDTQGAGDKVLGRREVLSLLGRNFNIPLDNKKVILAVCRLVPKKGIKEFIENVFAKISADYHDAVFLIAGDGPEKQKIASLINALGLEDKVFLLGCIENQSLLYKSLFAVSHLLVMPNIAVKGDAEGFGVVILEAAVNGVPVVAYDVDGISQALHNQSSGILIEPARADLFAEEVLSLLKDEKKRQDLINTAREYVAKNFGWDRIVNIYQQEYEQALRQAQK